MIIQHNLPAGNAKRALQKNNSKLSKALEKLSSGYAVNHASDNAAGLAVSEKMRAQISGIKQAVNNCQDGISFVQTFEGALNETVSIIQRARSLAVQSANGTYDDAVDRAAIESEYQQLCDEADQIADTDFNGVCMLNGGKMADKFTFLTKEGTMWLTPSKAEFPQKTFVSTFENVEGFPDITMSIELMPGAANNLVKDEELMRNLDILNGASVRAYYKDGIPQFSIEGLSNEDSSKFSVVTNGSEAVISTYTKHSGKVEIARVTCTELPHYASTSATGKWSSGSVATSSGYSAPQNTSATNYSASALAKYTTSYVNSSSATRAERQAYLDWVNATPTSTATLVPDTEFDEDTDPLKFVWSLDGKTYEDTVGSSGVPTSGPDLALYPDDYTGGPQIYIKNVRFTYDDEDLKAGSYFRVYTAHPTSTISGSWNGSPAMGGSVSMNQTWYTNAWLDNGNISVTLTYNKAEDKWYDSLGGSGSASTYGISYRYYSGDYYIKNGYYKRNLEQFYEADGTLPDGFKLSVSLSCPTYRTTTSGGYSYHQNLVHNDKSNNSTASQIDFKLGEYDPDNPDLGGVDYKIAKHGATYTFDGRTQADGSTGVWRDEDGNAVDLVSVGIYLPKNPDKNQILSIHDGMTITVSNPTMVGEDYIQADIRLFDDDRSANYYRRVYDNLTYNDSLTLQAGARTKDSVNFTFAYSSDGIGDLLSDLECSASGLGMDELSLSTQEKANSAIDKLDNALNKVTMIRSLFGAVQNRLEHKIDNLNNTDEDLTAAESRIRDTDMAEEMMNFTKEQILLQSSQAMLAQANSLPQGVLNLISG